MLAVCQDVVLIKVFQDTTNKDVFLDLTAYTSQGNWSIITRLVLFSFLEYGCDVGTPPVLRYSSCVKALPPIVEACIGGSRWGIMISE